MRWPLARGRWRTDTAGESQRLLERQVTIAATGCGVGRAQDTGEGVVTAGAVGLGTEERIESKYDRRRSTGDGLAINAGRWAWRRNEQWRQCKREGVGVNGGGTIDETRKDGDGRRE